MGASTASTGGQGASFSPVMGGPNGPSRTSVWLSPTGSEATCWRRSPTQERPAELVINEGLEETLDELKRRRIRTGIICDVGFTSGEQLRGVSWSAAGC